MTHQYSNGAKPPYFITTAIPFVNAQPHIGHALEFVLTDALARYHRLKGENVRFLTGTDENSLKNVQAAEGEGIPTQVLVDRNAAHFYDLGATLNLSFDDFIRTSVERRHLDGVVKLWQACDQAGDIYRRAYRGLYCVGCEQFYTDDELTAGLCPEHLTPPELVEEENYFFRLSRYADQLLALIESNQLRIVPDTRKNEVISFIRAGLHDFSISRSRARAHNWGIPVPGDPDQVMYVWFDALGNYITALDYATNGSLYGYYWQNNPQRVHVIGKGITRFHAVYWPAMLLSAGVPLPTTIFIHGYITVDGQKVSKSLGNAVDPVELAQAYGADALRYYLLREIKATEDGDFSRERFVRVYNADLADQLGNLLSRVGGMIARYYNGIVPAPGPAESIDQTLLDTAQSLPERVNTAMAQFAPHEALAAIWDLIGAANKYIVEVQPWVLAKQRQQDPAAETRLATILYNLAETLRLAADYCQPFLPATAGSIAQQLGITLDPNRDWAEVSSWGRYPAGTVVQPGGVLFPKLVSPEK
ncbi:MAG: methionine--tRNA ligase [Anaerolineae bacterium]|nr:methionine--tRNA ligase [Anaerolineae bacterium]